MRLTGKHIAAIVLITVGVFILLVIGLAAALSGGQSAPNASAPVSQAPAAAVPTQEPSERATLESQQATDVRGGETATDDGVSVLSEPLRFGEGTIGDGEYFCSMITMENNSSSEVPYNMFYWKLKNPEGIESNTGIFGSDTPLNSGELAPGDKVKGDVCFEFPDALTGDYVLSLDTNFGSGPKMRWIHTIS